MLDCRILDGRRREERKCSSGICTMGWKMDDVKCDANEEKWEKVEDREKRKK